MNYLRDERISRRGEASERINRRMTVFRKLGN
jgi:hypothetical protein